MINRILRIKTLPHLQGYYLQQPEQSVGVYAKVYSIQIERYLESVESLQIKDLKRDVLLRRLGEHGIWQRTPFVNKPFEYAVKGDLVWLWPAGYEFPLRISFFDQEAEEIAQVNPQTGAKILKAQQIWLSFSFALDEADVSQLGIAHPAELQSSNSFQVVFTSKSPQVADDYQYPSLFWNRLDLLLHELQRMRQEGFIVHIQTKHPDLLSEQVWSEVAASKENRQEPEIWSWIEKDLPAGFISQAEKHALFTDREIFGTIYLTQNLASEDNSMRLLRQLEGEISIGEYVVHEDYGIAIYAGLTQEKIDGQDRDYLLLRFAGSDELFVPVEQVNKLSRYIGNDGLAPELSRLGKGQWERLKKDLKVGVAIKAQELVEHYARRELARAKKIPNQESVDYQKFVASFPYEPTKDQIHATGEILADLESDTPMNRLLVGDVGFGKTEVAMRAAFRAVENGFQVCVLCPTTVLAAQHEEVFTQRFKEFGIEVRAVSRFRSAKENRESIDMAKEGKLEILVGTHRLLSKDVGFKNLGLLIVDEEQRFGVAQKERIKQLNYGTHFLSISATPIPRTLSMALTSIQSISIITEPPPHRKPVKTEVLKDNWSKVQEAIALEQARGGQVYFVHNRVQDLPTVQAKLNKLFPGLRLVVAHGQMSPQTLDASMTKFYRREADVLLTTTIIENGLDMPNVNTIVIHKAENFGLSQLYQLRGRVGRSERQAYCYLLVSRNLDAKDLEAQELQATSASAAAVAAARQKTADRLNALVESSHLGAGFSVASRDLEIRGAGDLLGEKQHGHISKVGYVLYMQLLAQEISRLKKAKNLLEQKPEYLTL